MLHKSTLNGMREVILAFISQKDFTHNVEQSKKKVNL